MPDKNNAAFRLPDGSNYILVVSLLTVITIGTVRNADAEIKMSKFETINYINKKLEYLVTYNASHVLANDTAYFITRGNVDRNGQISVHFSPSKRAPVGSARGPQRITVVTMDLIKATRIGLSLEWKTTGNRGSSADAVIISADEKCGKYESGGLEWPTDHVRIPTGKFTKERDRLVNALEHLLKILKKEDKEDPFD